MPLDRQSFYSCRTSFALAPSFLAYASRADYEKSEVRLQIAISKKSFSLCNPMNMHVNPNAYCRNVRLGSDFERQEQDHPPAFLNRNTISVRSG